jgi:hypothetical protein
VIKYRLHCVKGHEFEAWFSSSAAYDAQAQGQQVCCPECDGREVVKAVMAPNVALRGAAESAGDAQRKVPTVVHLLREVRRAVLATAEDVGGRFPEEARKIHYGEAPPRGIAGTASGEEARALIEEGIEILMLPPLPEEAN